MTLAAALARRPSSSYSGALSLPNDLTEASPETVIVLNPDGVILTWNRAASRLYGWTSAQAVGRSLKALVRTEVVALPERGDPICAKTTRVRRRTADGRPVLVEIRNARHPGNEGEREVALGVTVEIGTVAISDEDLATLRASADRYRALFQRAPVALMLADASGIGGLVRDLRAAGVSDLNAHIARDPDFLDRALDIVAVSEVNETAMRMFGAQHPTDLVQSVRHFWPEAPETFRRAMIARFDGVPYFAEETQMRTLDGRTVDVLFSLAFPAPDEFMGAALMGMLDITERLETEAELRRVTADFAQAARLLTLGEMTTSIAHEIKQPLSAILTNAQTTQRWLARDEPNLEKAGQLVARIAQSARHASDIIDRIQDMAGARPPARLPLDLNEIVRESLLFVRHESEGKGVHIRTALDASAPLILGDRVQLQQVVVNLLVNSIQAMTQAKSRRRDILVSTAVDAGRVTLALEDCGPGIAPDHVEQIFDGFFTTKPGGLGIGLAICQSIIAAHGGRISAANHSGGGARFELFIPYA